jgi:hypothetical protein
MTKRAQTCSKCFNFQFLVIKVIVYKAVIGTVKSVMVKTRDFFRTMSFTGAALLPCQKYMYIHRQTYETKYLDMC